MTIYTPLSHFRPPHLTVKNLFLRSRVFAASRRMRPPPGPHGSGRRKGASQHEGQNLLLPPLVEYAPGLAERALQGFGLHRLDARGYADGLLDIGGGPLRVPEEPAPVPALGARLRHHRHLVHTPFARQFDDEVAPAPVGAEQ